MKTRGPGGVIRQCYLENGNISSEFVETDAYSYDETEGVYYMDTSVLKAGEMFCIRRTVRIPIHGEQTCNADRRV